MFLSVHGYAEAISQRFGSSQYPWQLCDRLGRKQTMMLGFSGYLVFGLIIGIAFPRVVQITPLFVVFVRH